jgi:thioredoxin 1
MFRRISKSRVAIAILVSVLLLGAATPGCSEEGSSTGAQAVTGERDDHEPAAGALVTFVELGSDRCIPCIKMRSVMQEIQDRYGDQVRIVFYDVWTTEGRPYAGHYGIRVIPTQVFLDAQGQEYFRHEGYFPTSEVAKILALQGVR